MCLALELVGSWVELGFSVGKEIFGWALNAHQCLLIFPGVRISVMF